MRKSSRLDANPPPILDILASISSISGAKSSCLFVLSRIFFSSRSKIHQQFLSFSCKNPSY